MVRAVGSDTATGVLAYMMLWDRRKATSTVDRHREIDGVGVSYSSYSNDR